MTLSFIIVNNDLHLETFFVFCHNNFAILLSKNVFTKNVVKTVLGCFDHLEIYNSREHFFGEYRNERTSSRRRDAYDVFRELSCFFEHIVRGCRLK